RGRARPAPSPRRRPRWPGRPGGRRERGAGVLSHSSHGRGLSALAAHALLELLLRLLVQVAMAPRFGVVAEALVGEAQLILRLRRGWIGGDGFQKRLPC